MWMNVYEIEDAVARYAGHPILGRATRILEAYMHEVNRVSDGWCYWRGGSRPARKLEALIQSPATATDANLKAALTPIKSACTRHGMTFPAHIV